METIVVSGCGRCGSSLLMRMFHAADVPCFFRDEVSYEHPDTLAPENFDDVLRQCPGQAVKILDPQYAKSLGELPAAWIWIARDPEQQARSQVKLLQFTGVPVGFSAIPSMAAANLRDNAAIPLRLQKRPNTRVMVISFEELLGLPYATSSAIVEFVGRDLDSKAMARIVKNRSPKCRPDMNEEIRLSKLADAGKYEPTA